MRNIDEFTGRLGNRMFQHAYLYTQMRNGLIPDVYLQSEDHFKDCATDIKQMFGEGIGFLPYVSIHVRRTDYVDNRFYVDLSKTDYYKQAVAMFPDKKFLVFSDDTEFSKTLFPDTKVFQVMEGGTELEDFNMASSCEHHIIANSSFSWWYAYVSPSLGKTVVAPSVKNWYTDGVERTSCPQEWVRI